MGEISLWDFRFLSNMPANPIPKQVPCVFEFIVAKQRNGPTGKVKLAFLREFTRSENLVRQPPPEEV